ncbi:hypothetical protein DDZ13_11745 [Coraliomargarita sinensis]|uniref:Uncharacterized protein n=1 Tax=Coraliomargarita sinensis TaxID=2174842 RepID=A0A317ZF66_9BACT|nr:hypothetical protein DDZ13_11745 [Coraliomargarita sinensis]
MFIGLAGLALLCRRR